MNKIIVLLFVAAMVLTGCSTAADTASHNISVDAENFEIQRRIIFYNSITDVVLLLVEGKCSIEDVTGRPFEVTCKKDKTYLKHYLGRSDNTLYFAEHLDPAEVDTFHHRIIFRPETIIPNLDLDTSLND